MSQIVWTVVLICFLAGNVPAQAQVCKWVDSEGVTHYASECPEGVETQQVEIQPPPPQEQLDEAKRRADRMKEEAKAAKASASERANEARLQRQTAESNVDARAEACVQATLNSAILMVAAPVYYDENGELHHQRSPHSETYRGTRHHLDEQQRAAELRRYELQIADNCGESAAENQAQTEKFKDKFAQPYCNQLRSELAELEAQSSGIPPSRMRELRKQIADECK